MCCIVNTPDATPRAAYCIIHVANAASRAACRIVHVPDAAFRVACRIVHVPDAASSDACRIVCLPDGTSRAMCPGVHVLDTTSRAMDCFVDSSDAASWGYVSWVHVLDAASRARNCYADAPDAVPWAQRVRLCLPVMILSELCVCVLVPDSTFMSMCCKFHALMLLPGLCVAWLMPLMPLPGLLTSLRPPPEFVCHSDHVPVTTSGASKVL